MGNLWMGRGDVAERDYLLEVYFDGILLREWEGEQVIGGRGDECKDENIGNCRVELECEWHYR
jgi:hypothetical protein